MLCGKMAWNNESSAAQDIFQRLQHTAGLVPRSRALASATALHSHWRGSKRARERDRQTQSGLRHFLATRAHVASTKRRSPNYCTASDARTCMRPPLSQSRFSLRLSSLLTRSVAEMHQQQTETAAHLLSQMRMRPPSARRSLSLSLSLSLQPVSRQAATYKDTICHPRRTARHSLSSSSPSLALSLPFARRPFCARSSAAPTRSERRCFSVDI